MHQPVATVMHILANLPAPVAQDTFATLCALLPPPAADTPEARAACADAAFAAVAALDPGDAFEARLATQIIAADAQAKHCLGLAVAPGTAPEAAVRCRAQASAMMRHMQCGLRALERRQAAREKALAALQPAAMERAGYWFHEITVPEAEPAEPAAPPATPAFEDLTEAEQYAINYPGRAASIRAEGGLPARCNFGPPEPALVAAIVAGTSPTLRALDQPAHAAAT
jgi:hypothetical protein